MSYTIIFNAEAEEEFVAAGKWYEQQQSGLGDRFKQETEKQLQKIVSNPYTFHFSKKNYRESLIEHFPFTIVYTVNEEKNVITVWSVFHTSRNPRMKYRK